MEIINGKTYPLWQQFIDNKGKWIGGSLEDEGDSFDRQFLGAEMARTMIKDITLVSNGKESAYFSIEGNDFNCGFDVSCGGISGQQKKGWLTFSGYGGHTFRIKEKEETHVNGS